MPLSWSGTLSAFYGSKIFIIHYIFPQDPQKTQEKCEITKHMQGNSNNNNKHDISFNLKLSIFE